MTIVPKGNNYFEGLSTDTKPTDVPKYSHFFETDTNIEYVLNSSGTWIQAGAGSNPGEVNTASYPGTGGIGLTLTKSGANLPFKGIASGASGNIITSDDTTNKNVTIDLNQYLDFSRFTSTPANPASNIGRLYVKQVDTNNDGIFTIIKRNGSFVEVQIY
jgi:hypothetical protein